MDLLHRSDLGRYLNLCGLLGAGAEVGVADGTFARQILAAWRGGRLFLVDCWQGQGAAYRDVANQHDGWHEANLRAVEALAHSDSRATPVRGFSPAAAGRFADGSLDFVYLDANHSYLAVRDDLRAWYAKLRPGGLFAGHDYLDGYLGFGPDHNGGTLFGVKSAVDEFCREVVGRSAAFTLSDAPHVSWFFRKPTGRPSGRLSVLTAYDHSYARVGDVSRPNKLAYCVRHGYPFRCRTDGFDPSRPPAWSKLPFLLEELGGEDDWVFWTDADSLVMDPSVPLTRFLDENCDLVLPFDRVSGLNTGNFFVRGTAWARAFLRRVWAEEHLLHHPWWENAAVIALYQADEEVRRHVGVVPNRLFNGRLPDASYQAGDFVVHFPGLHHREVFMDNYAAMAR